MAFDFKHICTALESFRAHPNCFHEWDVWFPWEKESEFVAFWKQHTKLQAVEANSPIFIDLAAEKSIQDIVGYSTDRNRANARLRAILEKYVKAEARNET